MSTGRCGPPSRRGRSDDHPSRSSSPILTLRVLDPCSMGQSLGPVAPIEVMGFDPLLRDDRRAERKLAAKDRCGHDFGELVDLAGPVAVEQLQAFALCREPRTATVGG